MSPGGQSLRIETLLVTASTSSKSNGARSAGPNATKASAVYATASEMPPSQAEAGLGRCETLTGKDVIAGGPVRVILESRSNRVFSRGCEASEDVSFVRRALTTERGAFDLPLPHAGRFDLRVLRIGFAPTVGPTVELKEGETQSAKILAGSERISLARVIVRGRDECNTRRDAGLLVARVWEETRKALIASQLFASSKPEQVTQLHEESVSRPL
jgi:hypothetical protein